MKLNELQKKSDLLQMELNAVRDASDRSNSDKLKEIEALKKTVRSLEEDIEKLKN